MSYGRGYYDEGQAQNAMAVVAKWMGRDRNLKVVYHDGNAVVADIFKGIIRIPKLACSGGLTDESIQLLRHRIYHEAGHISDTKLSKNEYPQGVLFQILNAIEDRRMERAVSGKYPGAGPVFDFAHHYHNKRIAEDVAAGKVDAPLWEGLVAMSFQSEGLLPAWRLSEKAQKYLDAAFDKFSEWKGLRDAKGSLSLAKEVYDIMKDVHEQDKEEQEGEGESESEEGESDGQEGEEGESSPQHRDFDEEEQDGEPSSSDERLEKELAEESDGKDLGDYEDEDIAEALNELDPKDADYLSRKDLDEHRMVESTETDMETYKENREKVAAAVAGMVRAMEQALRARARCRKDKYQRRGKIDKSRLVQIAKNLSKEVFYKTRKGEKLETAVEIIIDESGSMGGQAVPVRLVAIAVAEALTQLNIPFEITGTTTKHMGSGPVPLDGLDRTNPLIYNHYKTFSQQWHSVKQSIVHSGSHNHNVDGEVVEWATRRLLGRSEARKVVLSLSDGQPESGHGNSTVMGRNIVRSCERARDAGVEVYGFGIGTVAPCQFYGKEYFVHLPSGEIDVTFAKSFVGILTAGRLMS